MTILVHEWVTGGGLAGSRLPASLATEGRAIRQAVAADFHRLVGADVVMTLDARFAGEIHPWRTVVIEPGQEVSTLCRLAAESDDTVLIAPETDGVLAERAALVGRAGGRSLGSTPEAVALTSDKLRFSEHLTGLGIPTPPTERFEPTRSGPIMFSYPAVVKPVDGAGCVGTYYCTSPDDLPRDVPLPGAMVIQPFCEGVPMSASFLVGPDGGVQLVGVTWQDIEIRDGRFSYRGGRLPAPDEVALGAPWDAVRAVPGLRGWVGVDFLRDPASGRCTVLEVNPRPTTSLVGLLHLYPPGALAGAWLGAFRGGGPGLSRKSPTFPGPGSSVRFWPDGTVDVVSGRSGLGSE